MFEIEFTLNAIELNIFIFAYQHKNYTKKQYHYQSETMLFKFATAPQTH